MSTMPDGGPAFPSQEGNFDTHGVYFYSGMTLRDYFAAAALQMLPHHGCGADLSIEDTAISAYQIADAMLKVRESKEAQETDST